MKKIKAYIRAVFIFISQPFAIRIDKYRRRKNFKDTCKKAEELWQLTGKPHYVIPTDRGKYMVINSGILNSYNKAMKKNGGRTFTHADMLKKAVYQTSSARIHTKDA